MPSQASPTLDRRSLNRAFLARQLLLERADLFRPAELAQLLLERRAVRIALMRSTIHLVSAEDCLELRPLSRQSLRVASGATTAGNSRESTRTS